MKNRSCLHLSGFAKSNVAHWSGRQKICLFVQPLGFFGTSSFEVFDLLETPPLFHRALLFSEFVKKAAKPPVIAVPPNREITVPGRDAQEFVDNPASADEENNHEHERGNIYPHTLGIIIFSSRKFDDVCHSKDGKGHASGQYYFVTMQYSRAHARSVVRDTLTSSESGTG